MKRICSRSWTLSTENNSIRAWTSASCSRASIFTCLHLCTRMAPISSHPTASSPKRRKLKTFSQDLATHDIRKSKQSSTRLIGKSIELTDVEKRLKQLLLDVADYTEKSSQSGAGRSDDATPQTLRDIGLELRFTGGWVRDKLLGTGSQDIDVSINKMTGLQFGTKLKEYLEDRENLSKHISGDDNPETAEKSLCGNLHKIAANPEKSKHLETVTIRILGLDVDLVNLRKETYTEQSRNPQMEFGTPEEDALRRDATINAMFYNLSTSKVEDFTERGMDDMENHIIRTPLDPYQTFKDDPLRVLRLIRFATRLGYTIDPAAEAAMSDPEIQIALTQKITRERIGKELEKMLKGPDPYEALHLIDRLGLYKTIFDDPTKKEQYEPNTDNLKNAYDTLYMLLHIDDDNQTAQTISLLILRNEEEKYLSWVLCAMIPWADAPVMESHKKGGKQTSLLAVLVAREGIKATNKVCEVLGASIHNSPEIISIKDAFTKQIAKSRNKVATEDDVTTREYLGMAIRRWGSSWRSQMVFAIIYDTVHSSSNADRTLAEFARFIAHLENLQVLEAYELKPIVDGTALSKALSIKPGPWMKPALDVVMQWQLRNPDKTDTTEAIEEIKAKQGELANSLALHFLRLTIRPSFAKTQHPSVTSTGRKSINESVARKFTQMEIDDTKTRPWKYDGYSLDVLTWVVSVADAQMVEKAWHLLIPPMLVVVDDSSPPVKAVGCRLFSEFLRATPPILLARTGLAGVIEEAITPCLLYLPTLTSEKECVALLTAAYPALLNLANVRYAGSTPKEKASEDRFKFLDKLVRKGILYGLSHAGEIVKVAQVLLDHLRQILLSLGIESVKHLKALLPIISRYLTDPFGPAYPPLLLSAINAMQSIILTSWPRITLHRFEILRALAICWVHISDLDDPCSLKGELRKAFEMLKAAATTANIELAEETRVLENENITLKGLFSSPSTT